MHADDFGDVVQHQRLHRLGAVREEGTLPVDDGARHFEQGLVAADQALDEPARLLQLVLQVFVVGRGGAAADELLVLVVDAEARRGAGCQIGAPYAADLLDRDIRRDVTGMARCDAAAGARVEVLDELDGLLQFLGRKPGGAFELFEIAVGQQGQVFGGGDPACVVEVRRAGGEYAHLQQQALAQVARGHAGRVEVLDLVHHRLHLVDLDRQVAGQGLLDLFERAGEVTVFIDGVDHGFGDAPVGGRENRHLHLPQQVLAQGGGRAVARIDVRQAVAALVARGAGAERFTVVFPVVVAAGQLLALRVIDGGVAVNRLLVARRALAALAVVAAAVGGDGFLDGGLAGFADGGLFFQFFQQRIVFQGLLDLLLQFERRQLQQADSLLQLRRDRQVLTEF